MITHPAIIPSTKAKPGYQISKPPAQINIPASSKEEERTVEDPIYSGLYLITGLRHKYNPEGITTLLNLSKDSIIS